MIREVRIDDIEAVTALEAICFPAAEAATKQALRQRIQTFPHSFLVMEEHQEIIGMINGCITNHNTISDDMFEDMHHHNAHAAYQAIFGLDVHPDHQHQGHAKALMNALMEQSKKEGRKGMILTCKKHLIAFYESFGYVNQGISASVHGGVTWYDMLLEF